MCCIEHILHAIAKPKDLAGLHIAVTAGPTQEPLDPVRYLTNHSTGKMGYAVARAAAMRGADVTLIHGPTALPPVQVHRGCAHHHGAADVRSCHQPL